MKTLPPSIEIFRPGRHIDDQGQVHEFAAADVAAIASGYAPAIREAPLTIGHPACDRPAWGWVDSLQVNADGRLVMDTRDVEPQFAEMVAARRFAKRSAAFYPPDHPANPTPGSWYLRHVAFLGAQPPAIAGLADLPAFADGDAGLVQFSEVSSMPDPIPAPTPAQLEAAKAAQLEAAKAAQAAAEKKVAELENRLVQFAEQRRADMHAAHVTFANAQVQAGRLLPKDAGSAAAVLDLLAEAQPVQFAEGGSTRTLAPADWLRQLLSQAAPVVSFGEFAPAPAPAGLDTPGTPGMSDAEIDRRARAHAAEKHVSYAEALAQVTSFSNRG